MCLPSPSIQAIEEATTAKSIVKYLREYNALKHQLFYQPSDPPALCLSRVPRWRRRGRLSEAALSCRVKILRVVTMVKVVNRWRQMAADITVGAASLVSLIAATSPRPDSDALSPSVTSPTYSAGMVSLFQTSLNVATSFLLLKTSVSLRLSQTSCRLMCVELLKYGIRSVYADYFVNFLCRRTSDSLLTSLNPYRFGKINAEQDQLNHRFI
ncbi:hypothetical protein ANCCAN_01105 [Ancylostoma caninum]|uniref:Uncharacterized protein n=1 Tax=Ancylostoma caninum TaxID=29170 RepID=A0A368HAT1_ANCCA|nr:hypothetical protein ANCCAN_01105 [Ancylostoma caninum]